MGTFKNLPAIFVAVLFCTSAARAEIKVIEVKGDKAIVNVTGEVITPGMPLHAGKYSDQFSDFDTSFQRRRVSISPSLKLSSERRSNTSSMTSSIDLSTAVGVNFKTLEFGGAVSFSNLTIPGGASINQFGIGPFLELNFIQNKPDNFFIPGASVTGLYLNSTTSKTTESGYGIKPTLFLKTFIQNNFGLRFDFGYMFTKMPAVNTSTTFLSAGLMAYLN